MEALIVFYVIGVPFAFWYSMLTNMQQDQRYGHTGQDPFRVLWELFAALLSWITVFSTLAFRIAFEYGVIRPTQGKDR